jgi:hypothetical protein
MIKAAFSISCDGWKIPGALLFCVFFTGRLSAQPPYLRNFNYVEVHASQAIEQMLEFKIPASVILAQAILESSSGTSELAKRSNNHFGIKCHREWGGDTILKDDDTNNECFRKYSNISDSYRDHSMFLLSRARYAHLFNLAVTDYKGWCYGLKNAGYATSPTYADRLIILIEDLKLYEFDGPEVLQRISLVLSETPQLRISPLSNQHNLAEKEGLTANDSFILTQAKNPKIAGK